jgi:predicted permease
MLPDIRYALRGFRRSPGFAVVAVVSLALGIGANTGIFNLVNAALLRRLPVRDPKRLVVFTISSPDRFGGSFVGPEQYRQIRDKNTVLEGFAAFTGAPMTLSGNGVAEFTVGQRVSANYFETLGVSALIGRVFGPDEDSVPKGPPTCVISYGLWLRRFGGDTGAIGRVIQINGQPVTVLGVTPKDFTGFDQGAQTDITVPLSSADSFGLRAFGRLKPGMSVAQAQAQLDVIYHQVQPQGRRSNRLSDARVVLRLGSQGMGGLRIKYERPLLMLLAVVGLVLLIACANIGNLLMARASGRERETAIRLALGAGRRRLVRQLLAESLLLTIGGAALGLVLAYFADHALVALAPGGVGGTPLILDVSLDWRVLLFTGGVAVLVTMLVGLAPAIQATRPDMGPYLKGETGVPAPRRFSLANALVVVQIAVSLVLLIGAGLFLRSLHNLKSVDPGFDPEQMVLLTVEPALSGYSQVAGRTFIETLVERARNLRGVVAVSPGLISPLSGDFSMGLISVPGYVPQPNERPEISTNWVGPDYFQTLKTPLITGRVFTNEDGQANNVAIINQKAAAHFWPHEDPIGKHVRIGRSAADFEIVGVVRDVKSESLRADAEASVYFPFRQNQRPHMTLHARVAGNATPVVSALMSEIHRLDPNLAASNVTTMAAQLDSTIALDRLMATLMALFGVLAVVLAAVGLYGVMAFGVAARTREIGIRMALGAGSGRVLRQILLESAVLTVIGIGLGVPGALWASRGVSSLLYGLSATDTQTFAALAFGLAGIALGAAWIPARTATRVDPMVALRYE